MPRRSRSGKHEVGIPVDDESSVVHNTQCVHRRETVSGRTVRRYANRAVDIPGCNGSAVCVNTGRVGNEGDGRSDVSFVAHVERKVVRYDGRADSLCQKAVRRIESPRRAAHMADSEGAVEFKASTIRRVNRRIHARVGKFDPVAVSEVIDDGAVLGRGANGFVTRFTPGNTGREDRRPGRFRVGDDERGNRSRHASERIHVQRVARTNGSPKFRSEKHKAPPSKRRSEADF